MRAIPSLVPTAALAGLILASPPAAATVMTVGCTNAGSCTLEELAQGATMTVGDKLFSQWSVRDFSTLPVALAQVAVVGIDDGGDPGIRYQADTALSASGFDLLDLDVDFTVSATDPAMRIAGGRVELEAFEFPAGNIGGRATIFTDIFSTGGVLLDASSLTADNFPPPIFLLSESWAFAPQSSVLVGNNILVGGDGLMDTATLNAFSQRFSQVDVPEPPVVGLVLVVLLATFISKVAPGGFTRRIAAR